MWSPTGFRKILHFQVILFITDHKLGLVGTEKSCSVSIISPLVALMMDQPVICKTQSFWILILMSRCNACLLGLNLCTNDKLGRLKPKPSL